MAELYKIPESKLIKEAQDFEKLLLEACDFQTRALLRLADLSVWPCGSSAKPTLTALCKSREIAEAIGLRQAYIKGILRQLTGCPVVMSIYYQIPEGQVFFDTEGEVTPARWYLCNRKEFGKAKIPLPG